MQLDGRQKGAGANLIGRRTYAPAPATHPAIAA